MAENAKTERLRTRQADVPEGETGLEPKNRTVMATMAWVKEQAEKGIQVDHSEPQLIRGEEICWFDWEDYQAKRQAQP